MSDAQDLAIRDKKLERRKIEQLGIELRVRGFSYSEISQILEQKHQIYISASKVQGVIDRGIGRTPLPNSNSLRAIENMRFDLMVKPMIAKLEEEGTENEKPSFSDKFRAAMMLHKISERRSNLNGLNLQATLMTVGMVGAQKDSTDLQAVFRQLKEEANEPEAIEADQESG